MRIKNIAIGIIAIVSLFSCDNLKQQPNADAAAPDGDGSYVSIRKLAKSQYDLYHGMPYLFTHVIMLNGEKHTTIVSLDTADWGNVFKTFIASDIEDKKYHGKYTVSMFSDNMTQSRSLYYEAKDPDLFTQNFQVSVDLFGNKLHSVYVETRKKSFWHTRTQKLLYIPEKIIQMQEFNSYIIGASETTIEEYRFGVDEND